MSLKARDFDRMLDKLKFKIRESGDKLAWLMHDGRPVLFTKRSQGSGDIKGNIPHFIRQQLKLSERDFRGVRDCTVSRDDYLQILRDKQIIP